MLVNRVAHRMVTSIAIATKDTHDRVLCLDHFGNAFLVMYTNPFS